MEKIGDKMESKLFKVLLIILVLLDLVLPNSFSNLSQNQIQAKGKTIEEFLFENSKSSLRPSIPGRIEGTGAYFEIKDSKYLNVSLLKRKGN